jgi:hypothetical protein
MPIGCFQRNNFAYFVLWHCNHQFAPLDDAPACLFSAWRSSELRDKADAEDDQYYVKQEDLWKTKSKKAKEQQKLERPVQNACIIWSRAGGRFCSQQKQAQS